MTPDLDDREELAELHDRYSEMATEELVEILLQAGEYRPEAVQIVRAVLEQRDPSWREANEAVVEIADRAMATRDEIERRAEAPMGWHRWLLCCLFCGMAIVWVVMQRERGYRRRVMLGWEAIVVGWAVRFAVLAAIW